MKRQKGFSLEQHKNLGQFLKPTRNRLHAEVISILNAYGKTSNVGKLADKAIRAIDALKSELDNCVCRENPLSPNDEVINVYYGFSVENDEIRRLGENGVVYFGIGQRVLWHGKPGTITGFEIKPYSYPVGYNITYDDGDEVINSARGEIEALLSDKEVRS